MTIFTLIIMFFHIFGWMFKSYLPTYVVGCWRLVGLSGHNPSEHLLYITNCFFFYLQAVTTARLCTQAYKYLSKEDELEAARYRPYICRLWVLVLRRGTVKGYSNFFSRSVSYISHLTSTNDRAIIKEHFLPWFNCRNKW